MPDKHQVVAMAKTCADADGVELKSFLIRAGCTTEKDLAKLWCVLMDRQRSEATGDTQSILEDFCVDTQDPIDSVADTDMATGMLMEPQQEDMSSC